jgi:hypothetical protein
MEPDSEPTVTRRRPRSHSSAGSQAEHEEGRPSLACDVVDQHVAAAVAPNSVRGHPLDRYTMHVTDDAQGPISYAVALAAATELKARVEATKIIRHPGEVGRARENVLREFLVSFCPRGFEFGTGFVFDAAGNMSRQQDIVIYRNSYQPVFNVGGIQNFPVECVVAVIEVKSSLNSQAPMNDALDGIATVKSLDRTGNGRNYVVAGGMQLVLNPKLHEHQIFSAVVMLGGMRSSRAIEIAAEWCRSHDRTLWPNGIVSAYEYSAYYDTPSDIPRSNTMMAQGIVSSVLGHSANTVPILDFLGQLISFLRVTPIIDFTPSNYFPTSLYYENYQPLVDERINRP